MAIVGLMGVTSKSVRLPVQRTKPLRGGKDRGIVHKSSASAARPIESDFAPCLYRCAVPCYSRAWLRSAAGSARSFTSRSSGTLPRTRPLPIYSICIKAKAVPVAASSSELASAGPTRSELRPRSLTALRIQLSSEGATWTGGGHRPMVLDRLLRQRLVPMCPGVILDRTSSSAVLRTRGAGTSAHQQARPRRR